MPDAMLMRMRERETRDNATKPDEKNDDEGEDEKDKYLYKIDAGNEWSPKPENPEPKRRITMPRTHTTPTAEKSFPGINQCRVAFRLPTTLLRSTLSTTPLAPSAVEAVELEEHRLLAPDPDPEPEVPLTVLTLPPEVPEAALPTSSACTPRPCPSSLTVALRRPKVE